MLELKAENSNTLDRLAADELTLDALEKISGGSDDLGADCATAGGVVGVVVGSLGGPVVALAAAAVGATAGYFVGHTIAQITKGTVQSK